MNSTELHTLAALAGTLGGILLVRGSVELLVTNIVIAIIAVAIAGLRIRYGKKSLG